jgi:hypothetical protein
MKLLEISPPRQSLSESKAVRHCVLYIHVAQHERAKLLGFHLEDLGRRRKKPHELIEAVVHGIWDAYSCMVAQGGRNHAATIVFSVAAQPCRNRLETWPQPRATTPAKRGPQPPQPLPIGGPKLVAPPRARGPSRSERPAPRLQLAPLVLRSPGRSTEKEPSPTTTAAGGATRATNFKTIGRFLYTLSSHFKESHFSTEPTNRAPQRAA